MTVGDRIKKLRESLEMSQTELAKKTQSSKQTIYKYENNIITNIPYNKILLLASSLGSTPAYLMGWEELEKETETDFQLMKSLLKRQGVNLTFSAFMSPIDKTKELEYYWIFDEGVGYRISVEEYQSLKKDIDSFVRFKLSELVDESHKFKPIQKDSISSSSYLEPLAAHDRTDIPKLARTKEAMQQENENHG